jgi:(p)ppGpp synthase/HD superfamily hydrolase
MEKIMGPNVEATILIMKGAHEGQKDKSGFPYWQHPLAVMHLLGPDASDEEKIVALLHDVLEDTPITSAVLRSCGYNERIIHAVELLSRPPQGTPNRPTYKEWIKSIAESRNLTAIRVKIADNKHNSSEERTELLPPEERGIALRYAKSLAVLEEAEYKLRMEQAINRLAVEWDYEVALAEDRENNGIYED